MPCSKGKGQKEKKKGILDSKKKYTLTFISLVYIISTDSSIHHLLLFLTFFFSLSEMTANSISRFSSIFVLNFTTSLKLSCWFSIFGQPHFEISKKPDDSDHEQSSPPSEGGVSGGVKLFTFRRPAAASAVGGAPRNGSSAISDKNIWNHRRFSHQWYCLVEQREQQFRRLGSSVVFLNPSP